MFLPVAEELLAGGGVRCRLLSLCELRGLRSPVARFTAAGVEVRRVLPFRLRRAAGLGRGLPGRPPRALRSLVYGSAWALLLRPRLARWLADPPDLAVVPNDAAFPYDFICRRLRERGVPFLLVQEGIRFAETVFQDEGIVRQGRQGATAVAAWGAASASFFRRQGVPEERIHQTGNPRFDAILRRDWSAPARELDRRLPPGSPTLLLLSNPIELWGFCSESEKLDLIRRFLVELGPLFAESGLRVVIKLHASEPVARFQALYADLPYAGRICTLGEAPLYPLLRLGDAVVILASTVGLEALLFDLPLGVLEIPGAGFVHDFVSGGGARGLGLGRPLSEQVAPMLRGETDAAAVRAYLDRQLAAREGATERIAALVRRLIAAPPAGASVEDAGQPDLLTGSRREPP